MFVGKYFRNRDRYNRHFSFPQRICSPRWGDVSPVVVVIPDINTLEFFNEDDEDLRTTDPINVDRSLHQFGEFIVMRTKYPK